MLARQINAYHQERQMTARILVTLGVVIFAVVVPILEINASHVANPEWPPHARLHEVWQLTTNCVIGALCLWLVWRKASVRLAGVLVISVMGGVLFAHVIEDMYGGSILSGNVSRTLFGLEFAAVAASIAVIMAVAAIMLAGRQRSAAGATTGATGRNDFRGKS